MFLLPLLLPPNSSWQLYNILMRVRRHWKADSTQSRRFKTFELAGANRKIVPFPFYEEWALKLQADGMS